MDNSSLAAGSTISHYRVVEKLGAGGMGEVYLAQDTKLDRKVALKILPGEAAVDRKRMQRFSQEAKAASALNHPNILTIHEIEQIDSTHFIATEFIDGQTLRNHLSRARMELNEALDVSIQVASALAAAHNAGIVHRDIKPENIMLRRDGLVKVLDFGLAKLVERPPPDSVDTEASTSFKTEAATVLGTAVYMSPEQARGVEVDARTDIFSLGVVLYEMMAGRLPFEGSTSREVLAGILTDKEPQPLARYAREVPAELERIVSKALRKNCEQRYQTIKDLLLDLKNLKEELEFERKLQRSVRPGSASATGEPGLDVIPIRSAARPEVSEPATGIFRKRGLLIGVPAMLVMVAIAGAYWYFTRTAARAINSIAVLPLVNVNVDPDTEYLSDGITDNIIERLSQLPDLRVMSHTAVFHYKGRESDPRTIGRELGVEAVLTGRLAKRSDALTISLELVDARDNRHLWGERYERKLSDLLAVQREIPVDISEKLRLRLGGESKERLARVNTTNPEAYQLYLKGRYSWEKWTQDGTRQAVEYFEEAIKKDPSYAAAYAGLADAYIFGSGVAGVPQKEAHRRAREAATKALALNPMLGEAHASLAEVLLYDDWDFAGAERGLKRAIELSPSYAEAHHQYSHLLLLLGRTDESMGLLEMKNCVNLPRAYNSVVVLSTVISSTCFFFLQNLETRVTASYDRAIRLSRKRRLIVSQERVLTFPRNL